MRSEAFANEPGRKKENGSPWLHLVDRNLFENEYAKIKIGCL